MPNEQPAHVDNTIAHGSASDTSALLEAARAADSTYQSDSNAPPGMKLVKVYDDPWTSFHAKLFQDQNSGAYVLAFRGTENNKGLLTAIQSWGTDLQGTLTGSTPQFNEAIAAANDANKISGGNVSYTGHSLGGLLASVATLATGKPATTFNAAGLNPLSYVNPGNGFQLHPGNASLVNNYVVPHDILTSAEKYTPFHAVGTQHQLPDVTSNPLTAHGAYIQAIEQEMAPQPEKIQSGLDTVLLGPTLKPAALATWSICLGDMHQQVMKGGSATVRLGPAQKPMSRRKDATSCNGTISDGLSSALVGG